MRRSVLKGVGSALPKTCVSNDELAQRVETSDEWIQERTGIKQRYFAGEGETTASLATDAARAALADAGLTIDNVDLIVLATATPDQTFPATATKVQHRLGGSGFPAFDVAAVCSGFLYALANTALVIGAVLATPLRIIESAWRGQYRAGDRGGDLQPHPRLGGPHHLRAVRRRCRCLRDFR